jgi:hypothetical protein
MINKCSLLQGLPQADLREDPVTLCEFRKRLQPIIGNLGKVHKGLENQEDVEADTPMVIFTIVSWRTTKDERVYSFARHDTI